MNNLAHQSIELILMIYGFAFFVLGIVVYILPKDHNSPSFFSRLWLIALFGVLHGAHELIVLLVFHYQEKSTLLQWLNSVLVLVSYLPLIEFARYTFFNTTYSLKWNVFWTYAAVIGGVIGIIIVDNNYAESLMLAALLVTGVPGTLLTGIAIICYAQEKNYYALRFYLYVAGICFIIYGILTFLLPDSNAVFNNIVPDYEELLNDLHIPVIRLMRMFCMFLEIITITLIVRYTHQQSFNHESSILLEIKHINESLEQRISEKDHELELLTAKLQEDTTQNKLAGQSLSNCELYQKAIFNASPDAMLISDEHGKIVMVNMQAEQLLGYKRNELINQSIELLIPEHLREQHYKHRSQYTEKPYYRFMSGVTSGVLAQHKDGHTIDVEISLSPIQTEDGFLFASAVRDIRRRKQIEAQLSTSEELFRLMANSSPVMIWMTDAEGDPTFANRAWLEFVGIDTAEAMTHKVWCNTVHPDDLETAFVDYYRNTQRSEPIAIEYRLRHASGEWRWVLDQGMPLYYNNDQFMGYIGSLIDITEHKNIEQTLRDAEAFISSVIDSLPEHIAVLDSKGVIIAVNRAWCHFAEENGSQNFLGLNYLNVCTQSCNTSNDLYATNAKAGIIAVQEGRLENFSMEYPCHSLNEEHWFLMQVIHLLGSQSKLVIVHKDITERKQTEADLRIAAIAFESNEPMVITNTNGIILRLNNAFTESTGFTAEDAIGNKISLLKSGRHDDEFYKAMWECLNRTGTWQGEIWDRRKNGEIYPKWLTITAVSGSDGIITHYVGTHADITERKVAENRIRNLAYYDPLTQLPNRRLLTDRLEHCINTVIRDNKIMALLLLDLDRFKVVNDSLGHLAGDELLQQVARRLSYRMRTTDTIARLGGDEFIVLLENIVCPDDASRIANIIIKDLSKPFQLSQKDDVYIGVSIGISLCPQHANNATQLIEQADAALYQAKAEGKGCYAYFSEYLTFLARERSELESRLRFAIEQQELRVYYQAQIDSHSGKIIGAEALVRWQCPVEGIILPGRFISIAETSDLIMGLGEWVLRETCKQGRQWLDAGLPKLVLAVNVSPQQFRRIDMSDLVVNILNETGFPAEHLEIEITESGLMEYSEKNRDHTHINATIETLNKLRNIGIGLAIDDFGTGYSSLAYLKRFPLNMLKIDKSFIENIPEDQNDMEIAATIIAMGHTLGLKVLAEGVETEEQLLFLQSKGCDCYQGYFKSKPLPADEFVTFFSEHS